MMAEENTIGIIIAAFVTLIVGIVILASVSTETTNKTLTLNAVNSNVTLTNAWNGTGVNVSKIHGPFSPLGDTSIDCYLTDYKLFNTTGTGLTETTDYILNTATGKFTLLNTTTVVNNIIRGNNVTAANYTYCPTGYLQNSFGRSTLNTVPGFFAIALMLVSVGLFWKAGKTFL